MTKHPNTHPGDREIKRSDGSIKAIYSFDPKTRIVRPLLGTPIPAGFPSPAQDYIEASLDLNEYLIKHPSSTFFIRVDGLSMINAGIYPDDILIVDRSLEALNNRIVVAIVDGELTLKRLKIISDIYWLVPENEEFEAIRISEETDLYIWGVVTYVIHKV
ncbi:MAG: translesion error-prone DNA polymerase V autoproteolytic subunit [Candidatus Cloacimonetes bacterium]|nr:translesion error-prone DNA polymerase V autoproteolytic subunit [Candidatus Cloacimonadota bacterium]